MSNNKIIDNQMNYAGHSGDKERESSNERVKHGETLGQVKERGAREQQWR